MREGKRRLQIGLIGYGAIARSAMTAVAAAGSPVTLAAVLLRPGRARPADLPEGCAVVHDAAGLLRCGVAEVFECAGHDAVFDHVGPLLRGGCPVSVVSAGALAKPGVAEELASAASDGNARLCVLSGALAGLEALSAARFGGLEEVVHTIVKPRAAWRGTPAEALIPQTSDGSSFEFFRGSARLAAQRFPKNANATAAVAMAGIGLDRTQTVMAAADTQTNVHRLYASGGFGVLNIEIAGTPLHGHGKTSALAAFSVARSIDQSAGGRRIVV